MKKLRYRNKVAKSILVIIIFGAILIFLSTMYADNRIIMGNATEGYMELPAISTENVLVTLDGQWEFYPERLICSNFRNGQLLNVPGTFNNIVTNHGSEVQYHYGTYRLKINIPSTADYGLNIQFLSSAYRVYIDGVLYRSNGIVGEKATDEVACWKPQYLSFHAQKGIHELVIQVSNFTCNSGGITNGILMGRQDTLYQYNILNTIRNAVFLGIIIGIGFYLIVFNCSMKNTRLSRSLGLFCISSFILELVLDGGILFYIYPTMSVVLAIRLEYVAYIGQILATNYFVYESYREFYKNIYFKIFMSIDISYFSLLLVTPITGVVYHDSILVLILIMNCLSAIYISILARKKYKRSATIFLSGFASLILGGILQLMDLRYFFHVERFVHNDFYILGLIIYMLSLSYILFLEIEDTFKKSQKAKRMEVAFLQAQIAPHFFFNVLNNIYYMMEVNSEAARTLLINFSKFLHVKHKFDYRKTVYYTLREELDLIDSFIEIENIRLNNQITYTTQVDEELLNTYVLPLLIQPLIENSIKHGFYGNALSIRVTITRKDDNIEYEISDNGKGMGQDRIIEVLQENITSQGIGLTNINYRLQDCYGQELVIESKIKEGTRVHFTLPIQLERKLN